MSGLPSELVIRCRATLQKCEEFSSQGSLRAVFITTELKPHQSEIPDAASKNERINLTISYLLSKPSAGRPVLPLFLAALRDNRFTDDALRNELEALRCDIEQELGIKTVDIPFVVAAMNKGEVHSLMDESLFDNPSVARIERDRFEKFQNALQSHKVVGWEEHYSDSRDEWVPHIYPGTTIDEIIVNMVDHINSQRETERLPRICRQTLSEDFFGSDKNKRMQTWETLKRSGGVLVVDAISLFNPLIRQHLLQSGIILNDRVAMLVLSPINPCTIQPNNLIENLMKEQMQLSFSRFDESLDNLCEIGVGDLRALRRWLVLALPKAAQNVQEQVLDTNKRFMQGATGQQSRGIQNSWLG